MGGTCGPDSARSRADGDNPISGCGPASDLRSRTRHTQAEEIYVILDGSGEVKLGDQVSEVRRLDAIRVSPEVARAFEAGPDGLEFLAFGPHHSGDGEPVDDLGSRNESGPSHGSATGIQALQLPVARLLGVDERVCDRVVAGLDVATDPWTELYDYRCLLAHAVPEQLDAERIWQARAALRACLPPPRRAGPQSSGPASLPRYRLDCAARGGRDQAGQQSSGGHPAPVADLRRRASSAGVVRGRCGSAA